jgi:nucleoside-diphosphate-sugar epimerase
MKKEKILITGASGFIGSHLTRSFQNQAEVYIAQRKGSSLESWRNIGLHDVKYIDVDSLRKGTIHFTSTGEDIPQFDCVYHLAAPSTLSAAENENNLVDGGIAFTLNMISFCARYKAKKLVIAGSSHEYGDHGCKPLTETMGLQPVHMYGAMKAAITTLSLVYAQQLNVPLHIARFFTVYGPADKPKNVIPSMIEATYTEVPLDLTPGEQIRDYVYIDDVIEGLHCLKNSSQPTGSIFNFGTGIGTSLLDVADILIQKEKVDPALFRFDVRPYYDKEVMYMVGNPSKAKKQLKWSAKVSLEEGLHLTYQWYHQYYKEVFCAR